MLATRLHYLFAVDPDWATEHMIARLSPGRSQETASLWSAYGWSPSVGPDLLRAFKGPLLEILRNEGPEYRKLGNLRSLFMTVCLEAPEELEDDKALGDCRLEPIGKLGGALAIALHQARQLGLGGLDIGRVPDVAQVFSDGLADGEVGGVMDGVLDRVIVAALPSP